MFYGLTWSARLRPIERLLGKSRDCLLERAAGIYFGALTLALRKPAPIRLV